MRMLACAAAAPVEAALAADGAATATATGASREAWAAAAGLSRGIGLTQGLGLDALAPCGRQLAEENAAAIATVALPAVPGLVARAGFRSVCLPLHWPEAAQADAPQALQRIDGLIDACLALGLFVVMELRPDARGAARTSPPSHGTCWQQAAARYAGRSTRLLFQLSFDPGLPVAQKNAVLAEGLKLIRQSNRRRVVVLGWGDAIGLPQLRLPADPDLIVAIGNDEPFRFTHQGLPTLPDAAQWRGTTCCNERELRLMSLPLDLARQWSDEHRMPVWLRRFMSHRSVPVELRARHARLMREAAEQRGLAWTYGELAGEFGAYDPAARQWSQPLLEALLGR